MKKMSPGISAILDIFIHPPVDLYFDRVPTGTYKCASVAMLLKALQQLVGFSIPEIICLKFLHPEKAFPKFVTEPGILIIARLRLLENAVFPIFVIVFGKTTLRRLLSLKE